MNLHDEDRATLVKVFGFSTCMTAAAIIVMVVAIAIVS